MDKDQEKQLGRIAEGLRMKARRVAAAEAETFYTQLYDILQKAGDHNGNIVIHEQNRCVGWFPNGDINDCTKRPGGADAPIGLWTQTFCEVVKGLYLEKRTEHWFNVEVENLLAREVSHA